MKRKTFLQSLLGLAALPQIAKALPKEEPQVLDCSVLKVPASGASMNLYSGDKNFIADRYTDYGVLIKSESINNEIVFHCKNLNPQHKTVRLTLESKLWDIEYFQYFKIDANSYLHFGPIKEKITALDIL